MKGNAKYDKGQGGFRLQVNVGQWGQYGYQYGIEIRVKSFENDENRIVL
jgi:hypothetical protein